MSDNNSSRYNGMAERLWRAQHQFSIFEDELDNLIGDYEKLGHDYYDASLEIVGAHNDMRLSIDAKAFIKNAGFAKVYVKHVDGWETHYFLTGNIETKPWRRRYVEDASAKTTNVMAGDPNPGYYEISYWPEGWDNACQYWLETGYMRIVPDPLDTQA